MDQRGITASVPQLGFWPLCVYAHGLYVLAQLLLPVFLPFNLIKGGVNAALTLLLYRPLTAALSPIRP